MDFGLSSKCDILVFFANAMDTVGEDGSQIRGCTIHYVFLNTVMAVQSEYDITKPVGMQRGKSWLDYQMRDKVRLAPAIYEGTFKMAVDGKGKSVLKLVDIAYKSNVQFVPYLLPGLDLPGMVPCDAPTLEEVRVALAALEKPAEKADDKTESAEKLPEESNKPENTEKADNKPGKKAV